MELISATSEEGSYSYDIGGYVQTSYINITAHKVDSYVNNAGYIDLNAGAVASVSGDPMEAGDHGFNYKCHIDISGVFELDFNLPNFLSVPGVNLTLFKKMNEFSKQISDLNNNMIAFIQSTNCCEISYEYNKTVVPIFRYLADHPDTVGCNTQDPRVEEGDKCADSSSENFMSAILKAITQITKVYTAIEPIFCIIKPIPGNPWLPMDFNWIRPILPYIEKFGKFSEKIMSGELIDVIIDPVKDINRSLFNCRQENNSMVVDKTISSTVIINSINEIENAANFNTAVEELEADTTAARVLALESIRKHSDTKDFAAEFKGIDDLLKAKDKADDEKAQLLINKYSDELQTISTNFSKSEQEKVAAYYQADKNKPLQCLQEYITFRPDLPKLPWINISLLPEDGDKTYLKNDLVPVIDEKAYDITYKDIYGDVKDFSNAEEHIMDEKIRFDRNTVYNPEFIKKFRKFINDNGEARSYKKVVTFDWENYIEDETLDAASFDIDWTDNAWAYLANKSTLEEVMDLDYEANSNDVISEEEDTPEVILKNNSLITMHIAEIQRRAGLLSKKLETLYDEDKRNWSDYRQKALSVLKSIKEEYKQEGEDIEDTTDWDDWNWWEYFTRAITSYTVEKAELTFWSTFGNYQSIDLIKEPFDEANSDAFNMYLDTNNHKLAVLQEIVNAYIIDRKNLLGNVAKIAFNNDIEIFTTSVEDLKDNVGYIHGLFYSVKEEVASEWRINLPEGTTGEIVPYLPETYAPDTEYLLITQLYRLTVDAIKDDASHYSDYLGYLNNLTANNAYTKIFATTMKLLSVVFQEIMPGIYVHKVPKTESSSTEGVLDRAVDAILETRPVELELSESNSTSQNIEGYLLRMFKYERIKKEYFVMIDDNVAYKFYVVFNPEIKLGCNLICELIQFVVNYLLAIIKKLLMIIIYWLIDYLVPDWLKNLIRLILYKLKCFLMMAYNVSSDEDKNRLLKIDNTYDSFMEAIKNRVALYPYDACAKTAIENAEAEAAEDNDDTSDATSDTQVDTAVAHELGIYFANADLTRLQAISRYNYESVKIVINKDSLATLSNLVVKDYDDTLNGPSATDLSALVNGFDPEIDPVITDNWYITIAANEDVIINNLDLSLLNTAMTMISTDSYKSTADVTDKYDAHVVSNRFSTLNVATSVIQLQDSETESFLTLLESNKSLLKIMFKKEAESDIVSLVLTDNTPYVTAAVATATTEEIIGSAPLTRVIINLVDYEILYDSRYNLSYIIYDATNFFPVGNDITGTLNTMYNGMSSSVQDSILCRIDGATIGSTTSSTEEVVVNDTFVTSPPVSNPGVNPNPDTAEALAEAGVSQARTETPVIFNCFNSSGTIVELLEANYESWIALGLIPDPTPPAPEIPETP